MIRQILVMVLVGVSANLSWGAEPTEKTTDGFSWTLRAREKNDAKGERYHLTYTSETWQPSRTAIIVCDMWDTHHSENAANRTAELATRMNQVLTEARKRGATIIHAPSGCMDSYAGHPARKHALETPRSKNLPEDIGKWCTQIPAEEQGKYPLDQTEADDDDPGQLKQFHEKLKARGRDPRRPWKYQIDRLTIHDEDYISDNGEEIWSILEDQAIPNVILLGVHTNMCVLGRPFGLRQMAKNGKHVVLMRDMTDTMYNPKKSPYVSHFTGTDLIIEHIEKYVCPTVTSDQFLGGKPFRFAGDTRKRLLMLIAEREYRTNETLPEFALAHLGHDYSVEYVYADPKDRNTLRGIEEIATADALLVSVRRRTLPAEQLQAIRQFVEDGKPVIGIRTANHAFAVRNGKAPEGRAVWQSFDADIFGGNYHGHYGSGPQVTLTIAESQSEHPILSEVDVKSLTGRGSLYQTKPLADSATELIAGIIPGKDSEPVAWINLPKTGNRVFYTSLGHVDDFRQSEFQTLLKNAIDWASKTKVHNDQ